MSFASSSTKNIKIFFAYSQHREDERLRQALEDHLYELRSLGVDSKWHKYHIETEQDWEGCIFRETLSTSSGVTGVTGLTEAQKATLKALGAVEDGE